MDQQRAQQVQQLPQLKIINDPPTFSGNTRELDGFLTRIELAIEANPQRFVNEAARVKFIMSYLTGKALNWASCLRRNNNPILHNVQQFVTELRRNFGDPDVEAVVANAKLCNIRQFKYGQVVSYISEFRKVSQYSNFNEAAKIYMFIKGLHPKMREHLALVNPNPNDLNALFRDVVNIEGLTKRNDIREYYMTHQDRRNYNNDDPMDVDLYRIRKGQKDIRYFPTHKKNYEEQKEDNLERRRKGLCFICGKPGHLKFNCPNKKRPKGVKLINKIDNETNPESTSLRRIKLIENSENIFNVLKIVDIENLNEKKKSNIIDFYIKTNDTEEVKAKVLIDSGSDLNFIHPEFTRINNIKLNSIEKPFKVAGLGHGASNVTKVTEKCTLRFRNHFEVIQLYSLRIPDVDIILGLPWIEKHCPSNYHDSKKISFSSGYCARHCNVGKRKRINKKKSKKGMVKVKSVADEVTVDHESTISRKREYLSDSDSDDAEEITIRGRCTRVKTCNEFPDKTLGSDSFIINYNSEIYNTYNFESDDEIFEFSNSNSINLDRVLEICNVNKSCNCVNVNIKNNNKDKLATEPLNYSDKNRVEKNLCFICNSLKSSKFGDNVDEYVGVPPIYREYVEVFNEKNCNILPPHREYDCEIKLKNNSNLFYGPIYPLTEAERDELKKYIRENLEKGFIRKSTSPAGAPVLFVKKKDGSLRLVIDYRKLNEMTIRNSYPLPLISELLDRVKGAKIFTKLDLKSAYNLVRIKEGDEFKTAFRTRYGHFEYLVMPFGLKNAPATFQHFINDVLSDYLDDFVISYIDDILIFSNSLEEHHKHVKMVLKKLLENNLYVKLEKCEFDVSETAFLGYIISKDGLKVDPSKIEAILDWPIPTTVKEVQSFIGLCNYYRIFIKEFAAIARPLHKLTRKNVPFVWGADQQKAFNKLKELFTSAPILRNPDSNKPFIVETDASNFAVGAILSQEFDGQLHPIAFLSSSLTKSQQNYPIYDKELLAIKVALEEWRHYLEGARHPFTIYTDHKNLTFPRKPEMLSQRQIRWYEFLSRFEFNLVYRSGKKSGKPDILSRRSDHLFDYSRKFSCDVINYKSFDESLINSILKSLNSDDLFIKIKSYISNKNNENSPIKFIDRCKIDKEGFLLFDNLIYVPKTLRTRVLELHHDSVTAGHFGVAKTFDLINRNFWWPKLRYDVKNFIRSCEICCRAKVPRHKPYGLLSPLSTPNRPWSDISMDFIVELPKSKDMTTVMTVVDRLTKMAHFIPLRCLPTASIAADSFINNIFRLHGFPDSIVSDRGTQFTSDFWNRLCDLFNIKLSFSTSNHPQTDGQTERVNGILEQYLRCFINERQNNWVDLLPFAEFAYNNTLQQSINQSPFFANYGYNPKFSLEIPSSDRPHRADISVKNINENINFLKENLDAAKETYKKYADFKRLPTPDFEVGKKVWLLKGSTTKNVKKKLTDQMLGPFEIVKKVSPLAYELNLPNNMRCHPVFHVSLLEPYYENEFVNRNNRKRMNIKLTTDIVDRIPEKIIGMRTYRGKNRFLVSWKDLASSEDTWIDEDQIYDRQLIQEYYRKSKKNKLNNVVDDGDKDFNEEYIRHKYQPFVIDIPSRKLNSTVRRSST